MTSIQHNGTPKLKEVCMVSWVNHHIIVRLLMGLGAGVLLALVGSGIGVAQAAEATTSTVAVQTVASTADTTSTKGKGKPHVTMIKFVHHYDVSTPTLK